MAEGGTWVGQVQARSAGNVHSKGLSSEEVACKSAGDTFGLREGEQIGFIRLYTQTASLESTAGTMDTQHVRKEAQRGVITLECK